jgi:uncharacterized protein (TIGR02300 family)
MARDSALKITTFRESRAFARQANGDKDVAKSEWGLKRVCPNCGIRYYDMKKNPPVCPSCGKVFDPESQVRTRRGRAAPKAVVVEAPPPVEEVILPAVEGEEAEEAVIEDAEELGEDGAVEEVVEAGEEEP